MHPQAVLARAIAFDDVLVMFDSCRSRGGIYYRPCRHRSDNCIQAGINRKLLHCSAIIKRSVGHPLLVCDSQDIAFMCGGRKAIVYD